MQLIYEQIVKSVCDRVTNWVNSVCHKVFVSVALSIQIGEVARSQRNSNVSELVLIQLEEQTRRPMT